LVLREEAKQQSVTRTNSAMQTQLQSMAKSAFKMTKNTVMQVSETEKKVKEATSNDKWGPSSTQMRDISQMTHSYSELPIIMGTIWRRLNDHGKYWRHVYKSLLLIDYLLRNGSEQVVREARSNVIQIQTLTEFQYVDETDKDVGLSVRERAKLIVEILHDEKKLRAEREKAKATAKKFTVGIGSDTPGWYQDSASGGMGSDSYRDRASSYADSERGSRSDPPSRRSADSESEDEGEEEPAPAPKSSGGNRPRAPSVEGPGTVRPPAATKTTGAPPPNLFDMDIPAPAPTSSHNFFDPVPSSGGSGASNFGNFNATPAPSSGFGALPPTHPTPNTGFGAFPPTNTVTAYPPSNNGAFPPNNNPNAFNTTTTTNPNNAWGFSSTPTTAPANNNATAWDDFQGSPAPAAQEAKPEDPTDPWAKKHLFDLDLSKPASSGSSTQNKTPMGSMGAGMGSMGAMGAAKPMGSTGMGTMGGGNTMSPMMGRGNPAPMGGMGSPGMMHPGMGGNMMGNPMMGNPGMGGNMGGNMGGMGSPMMGGHMGMGGGMGMGGNPGMMNPGMGGNMGGNMGMNNGMGGNMMGGNMGMNNGMGGNMGGNMGRGANTWTM